MHLATFQESGPPQGLSEANRGTPSAAAKPSSKPPGLEHLAQLITRKHQEATPQRQASTPRDHPPSSTLRDSTPGQHRLSFSGLQAPSPALEPSTSAPLNPTPISNPLLAGSASGASAPGVSALGGSASGSGVMPPAPIAQPQASPSAEPHPPSASPAAGPSPFAAQAAQEEVGPSGDPSGGQEHCELASSGEQRPGSEAGQQESGLAEGQSRLNSVSSLAEWATASFMLTGKDRKHSVRSHSAGPNSGSGGGSEAAEQVGLGAVGLQLWAEMGHVLEGCYGWLCLSVGGSRAGCVSKTAV